MHNVDKKIFFNSFENLSNVRYQSKINTVSAVIERHSRLERHFD